MALMWSPATAEIYSKLQKSDQAAAVIAKHLPAALFKSRRASGRTNTEGKEEEPKIDSEQAALRRQLRNQHGFWPLGGLMLLQITSFPLDTQSIIKSERDRCMYC